MNSRMQILHSNEEKLRGELEAMKRELISTRSAVVAAQEDADKKSLEIMKLHSDIVEEKKIREVEFAANTQQLRSSMGQYFRLGWVQGQHRVEDRIYTSPEEFDRSYQIGEGSYEYLAGMNPDDLPMSPSPQRERYVSPTADGNPVSPIVMVQNPPLADPAEAQVSEGRNATA